jgi:NitT/TauT family transport system substrate-binding protein
MIGGAQQMRIGFPQFAAAFACLVWASVASAADIVKVSRPDATAFVFSALDIGTDVGIFKKYDIAIENSVSPRGQQVLAAGSVDVTISGGTDIALIAKGSPTKAIAAMAGAPYSLAIVLRADSPLKAADLKGKSIGVSTTRSLTSWMAREFSRQQGWGADGMTLVGTGGTEGSLAALFSNNLDAAVLSSEMGYKLQAEGRGRVLVNFGDIVSDFLVHVIYSSDRTIAERPDVLRRFLKAWFETVAYMKTHRDETIRISRKTTGLSEALAERAYDVQMPMYSTDGRFPPKALAAIMRAAVELGQLDTIPPDPSKFYTERFLP